MKILQFNGPWQFSIEEASIPSFGPQKLSSGRTPSESAGAMSMDLQAKAVDGSRVWSWGTRWPVLS